MNVAQHIERNLRRHASNTAVFFEGKSLSYQELNRQVNQVARGLHHLGIRRGDRVALFLPNSPAFVLAYLGALKIGAIAVSLNVMLKQAEVSFMLTDSQAMALITNENLLENVSPSPPALKHIIVAGGRAAEGQISLADLMAQASPTFTAVAMSPQEPAAIVYSSGTTGFPKGVTLSHSNIITNMQAKKQHCGMTAEDRAILFVPLFHCFGQNAVLNSILNVGGTIVLQAGFQTESTLETITREKVTMFFGVPTIFILLLQQASRADLQSVRYYFSAAAKMPEEISRQWHEKFGHFIYEGYGLTETSPFASYNHAEQYKFGSIGSPITGVEMKIVDVANGRELPPGELGEIVIRGPNVMLGYWNNPEATAQAIKKGWFHTGDIGKVDENGYFYIVDRLKDMINVAGMKVYPVEVENVLYKHPAVAEAAVYGVPDTITGERVQADVVLKHDYEVTDAELLAACRQHIANFKVPAKINLTAAIPKNATGKILKRELRKNQ